jgi:hypothetical protein
MIKKMKRGIFWGGLIALVAFIINGLHHTFGGQRSFGNAPHGHGPGRMMGQQGGLGNRGGFAPHQFSHHGGDFHWLGILFFLVIAVAFLFMLVRWLRRKANSSSMVHSTTALELPTPVVNPNGTILDQWEKDLMKKKESE